MGGFIETMVPAAMARGIKTQDFWFEASNHRKSVERLLVCEKNGEIVPRRKNALKLLHLKTCCVILSAGVEVQIISVHIKNPPNKLMFSLFFFKIPRDPHILKKRRADYQQKESSDIWKHLKILF